MTASAQAVVADARAPARLQATVLNGALLSASEALLRCANFALAVLIAREFSASALGSYATAIAVSTCAMTIADGGLQLASIRRIGKDVTTVDFVASEFLAAKLLLLPAAVIIAGAAFAAERSITMWFVAVAIFLRVMVQSFGQMNFAVLKGLGAVPAIGAVQLLHFAVLSVTLAAMWYERSSLAAVLVGALLCQCGEWAASSIWLRHRNVHLQAIPLARCWSFVRDSIPVGVTSTIVTLVLRLDLIVLSAFAGSGQVGHFAAAQLPITAMYLAAWLFGSVLLPQLMAARTVPEDLDRLVRTATKWLVVTTLPVTAVAVLGAPVFIRTLFGSAYGESSKLLAILLLSTPFIWLNALYLHRAISLDDKRTHAYAYFATMVAAMLLSVALARVWGAIGIAAAVVIREVSLLVVLTMVQRRRTA